MHFFIIFFLSLFTFLNASEENSTSSPVVIDAIASKIEEVDEQLAGEGKAPKEAQSHDDEETAAKEEATDEEKHLTTKDQNLKQHKGIGLVFQDTPSIPRMLFIIHRSFSNVLSFTIANAEEEPKSYHFMIAKLHPHIKFGSYTSKEQQDLYVAYISQSHKNQWEIFAGINSISGEMITLAEDNTSLHPFLKLALWEIKLQVKDISSDDESIRNVCDISTMHPTDWEEFLYQITSPHKGMHKGENIYDCENLTSAFADRSIILQQFFNEEGKEDNRVDIFTTLACFQPFYVNRACQRKLKAQLGDSWLETGSPRHFSKTGIELDPTLDRQTGWTKVDCSARFKDFAQFETLAAKLKTQKHEELKRNIPTDYLDLYELKSIIEVKLYMRLSVNILPKETVGISFIQLQGFIQKIKEKIEKLKEGSSQDADAIQCLEELLENEEKKNTTLKAHAKKLVEEMKYRSLAKNEFEEIFKDLPNTFGDHLRSIEEQEFDELFATQKGFIDSDINRLPRAKRPTNYEVQIHLILWARKIFYTLHNNFYMLGHRFEQYFEKLFSEKQGTKERLQHMTASDDDAQEEALTHLDSGLLQLSLLEQQEKAAMELYSEYEKIVKIIRKTYINFGYLPGFSKAQEGLVESAVDEVLERSVLAEKEKAPPPVQKAVDKAVTPSLQQISATEKKEEKSNFTATSSGKPVRNPRARRAAVLGAERAGTASATKPPAEQEVV